MKKKFNLNYYYFSCGNDTVGNQSYHYTKIEQNPEKIKIKYFDIVQVERLTQKKLTKLKNNYEAKECPKNLKAQEGKKLK